MLRGVGVLLDVCRGLCCVGQCSGVLVPLSIMVGGGGVSDLSEGLVWSVCPGPVCCAYLCSIVLKSWMVVCIGCFEYSDAILCRVFSASRWAWFGPVVGVFVEVEVGASALHSNVRVMWVAGVPVLVES